MYYLQVLSIKENSFYRIDSKPNVLDKFDCVLLTHLAYVELRDKNRERAESCLRVAVNKDRIFDAKPDYDAKHLRHIHLDESLMLRYGKL